MQIWLQTVALVNAVWALLCAQPFKSCFSIILLLISFGIFIRSTQPFLIQWKHEIEMLNNKKISTTESISPSAISTGDISVKNNTAPIQISVGSPGSTQIVNQQRVIMPEAKLEKGREGNNFIMRIVLTQTTGIWDQGTDFKLQVKTTGPFERCQIIQGFPPAQFNVRISENKEQGYYSYATTTAPLKDEPIVLKIISKDQIDISQLGIEPLAK